MRCKPISVALPFLVVTLSLVPAKGIPVPGINLPALTHGAHLIVVGQVTTVREEGRTRIDRQGRQSIPARRMLATLVVDRVLKGQAEGATISVGFLAPEIPLGYAEISETQFGMFFLRKAPQRGYVVLDPYYPFVVASHDVAVTEGTVLDRVVAEVAQVLFTPRASPNELKRAIKALDTANTEFSTAALQRAAGNRNLDMPFRLDAAAALLRRNDISMLEMVTDVLLNSSQYIVNGLLNKLAFALQDGVKDPQAVPALSRLLHARYVQTRRGAAAALRHTGVEAAIEPLAMALQDSDREVRYQAVLGLAAITGQSEWGPSIDLFQQKEQHYLTYWRDWVKTR